MRIGEGGCKMESSRHLKDLNEALSFRSKIYQDPYIVHLSSVVYQSSITGTAHQATQYYLLPPSLRFSKCLTSHLPLLMPRHPRSRIFKHLA